MVNALTVVQFLSTLKVASSAAVAVGLLVVIEEVMKMSYLTEEQISKYAQLVGRGKTLALISRLKDLEKRKQGKLLKVFAFPQDSKYVPAIRVAGLWLTYFGFDLGDEVTLIAKQNELVITKNQKDKNKGGGKYA